MVWRSRFGVLVLAATWLMAACTSGSGAGSTAGTVGPSAGSSSVAPTALTVFAAASLRKAFVAVEAAYRSAHPEVSLAFSFDASSALETQIEQGAPADVFASADTKNPRKLVDAGLAAGRPIEFAANRLTLIVPASNPGRVATPLDLARPGLKIVAAGDDVPITTYADQLLAQLARLPGYPPDFVARVKSAIVSREDNVSAVVAKIELGEGDAAIVYETDARTSTTVGEVPVPATANVSATYAAVAVKASDHGDAAAGFIAWLAGPDGQAVLAGYGFLPPP